MKQTPDDASGIFVSVRNVTLQVPTFMQHQKSNDSWARAMVGAAFDRPERRLHTLLDGISFDLAEGDRVALIGRNGAGKTTLLHLLTGCYSPTEGAVEIRGSRQALLNVTLGFNPEATVQENVFLRGAAMGLPLHVMREIMPEVLEFADLQAKAGQKLGTLSAGQRMRLGFATSTSIQPDIMLLDEWIGTGDAEFIRRARERMHDRVTGSRIMVVASHSSGLVAGVCNRGLVLEGGRIVFDGGIKEALGYYKGILAQPAAASPPPAAAPATFSRRPVKFLHEFGLGFSAPVHCLFENKESAEGVLRYGALVDVDAPSLSVELQNLVGQLIASGYSLDRVEGKPLPNSFSLGKGDDVATITLTPYAAGAARGAPNSVGRLHLSLTRRLES